MLFERGYHLGMQAPAAAPRLCNLVRVNPEHPDLLYRPLLPRLLLLGPLLLTPRTIAKAWTTLLVQELSASGTTTRRRRPRSCEQGGAAAGHRAQARGGSSSAAERRSGREGEREGMSLHSYNMCSTIAPCNTAIESM